MANPEVTIPPGEFIYIEISYVGLSASKKSNWAQTTLDTASSIGPITKMIRSFNRREYMSNARSQRFVCSTTIGIKLLICNSWELDILTNLIHQLTGS